LPYETEIVILNSIAPSVERQGDVNYLICRLFYDTKIVISSKLDNSSVDRLSDPNYLICRLFYEAKIVILKFDNPLS